jgi:hypothetical protein
MNTTPLRHLPAIALVTLALAGPGCDPTEQPPAAKAPPTAAPKAGAKAVEVKRTPLGKNITLEVEGETRRVLVLAEVCFREGPLELLLCRKFTKEHEAVLSADLDARQLHLALLATGAKAGSPVKFEPKYQPAHGSIIKVTLRYDQDGQVVTVPAQQWVRDGRTKKELPHDWVFAGSLLFDDPDDPAKPKIYAANGGDVICVSNFPDAMLDLPVNSPQEDAERPYEANTDKIPPLGTKVTVVLEPVAEKKRSAGAPERRSAKKS